MRRGIGLALAGLGAFLAAAAGLLAVNGPARLAVYPVNTFLSTQLTGRGAAYLSPALKPVTGATLAVTTTVRGNPFLGAPGVVVWDQFTSVYDPGRRLQVSFSQYRLAFDRRTGELVSCCEASVNGNTAVRLTGHYRWPIGARPATYLMFDPVLRRPWPARYAGTASVGGIRVYRFVQQIPPTWIGGEPVPASLAGGKGAGLVTLPEGYTATSTFAVDPVTGAQLGQTTHEQLTLVAAAGGRRILLLRASLALTPHSRHELLALDRRARARLTLLTRTAPLAGGGLAVVLLATGILLARPGQPREPGERDQRPVDPGPARPDSQDVTATQPFPRPVF